MIRRKLAGMGGVSGVSISPSTLSAATLKVIGAVLLVVPGFLAGILGLALLTPSIRALLVRHRDSSRRDTREIDLSSTDWREVPDEPVKRIRRRKKPDAA